VSVEDTLKQVPLFGGFTPKQLKSLATWTTTRSYPAGQVIVSEGQTGMGLYCIQSGRVKITKRTSSGERELRQMGAGESFGEISLLDDRPRSATVTALEPTTAVLVDKSQFKAGMVTHPEIASAILPVVVGWLREADTKLAELS
jgi:CRP/FNR family cyclic AMP-dependent transcriptional regulator